MFSRLFGLLKNGAGKVKEISVSCFQKGKSFFKKVGVLALKGWSVLKRGAVKAGQFFVFCFHHTLRFFKWVGRAAVRFAFFVKRVWNAAAHSAFVLELGFGLRRVGQLFKRHFSGVTFKNLFVKIKVCFCDLLRSILRCRVTARAFFKLVAPVLLVVMIICSSFGLSDVVFANGVTYGGEFLGMVQNATILQSAIDIFSNRVDTVNPISYIEPAKLTTNLANRRFILDENALADAMLQHSDLIYYGYGLYVNGTLQAVSDSDAVYNQQLAAYLDQYRVEGEEAVLALGDDIKIVQNYYAVDMYRTDLQIKTLVMETLQLSVKKTVKEAYEVEIEYETEEIESNSYYKGHRQVRRYGKNGVKLVTDTVEYLNGEEVSRETISEEVLEEPVSKQIVVGTKVKQNSTQAKPIGGQMLWPVQDVDNVVITSYWGDGRNHKGLDIAAPKNTHIYAAMDGTVTYAGWYGGYGYLVKVKHSDTVETWYGHCNSFNVSKGDKVKMGEVIAFVGTTGDSTGYHVHFEVWIDGTRVNPAPYLGL